MKKQNNLAIDASEYTYNEVMVYSAMVQNIFGIESFSIGLLKESLQDIARLAPKDYEILSTKFHFSDISEDVSYDDESLKKAKESLIIMNKVSPFLTKPRAEAKRKEYETLIRLDENVLNHSLYFENWETKLEYILDNFWEKSKSNPEIESFDNFSKLIHRLQKALQRKNIFTINDLSKYCEKYQNLPIEESRKKAILEIRDLGSKCLGILKEALKEFNFQIA